MITVEVIVQPNAVTVPVKVENKTVAQDVKSFAGVPPAPTGAPKVLKSGGGGAFDYGWEDLDSSEGGGEGGDGASAYQIAVANGFVGTESDWLVSLKGEDGEAGAAGAPGDVGADGASAYQIAVANGFVGTESEWLASLNGEDGEAGAAGAPGADGASAYQIAVANGFVGTEFEWLASLNGEDGEAGAAGAPGADGVDGASAYQIAVANGFVGTESEWLASLNGEDGGAGLSLDQIEALDYLTETYPAPYTWVVDDFLNWATGDSRMPFKINHFSGASTASTTNTTDVYRHPGVVRLVSGTNASGSSVRVWNNASRALPAEGGCKAFFVCRFLAFVDHNHYLGWGNNNIFGVNSENITIGVYGFVDADGALSIVHEGGSGKVVSASTLPLTLDTWYGIRITTGDTSTLELFDDDGILIGSLTVGGSYPSSITQGAVPLFISASISTSSVPMSDLDLIAIKTPSLPMRNWIK